MVVNAPTCNLCNIRPKSYKEAQELSLWAINSKRDNYCFWAFVTRLEGQDKNKPKHERANFVGLTQVKIAKLLKIPAPSVHFIEKKALKALSKKPEAKELLEMMAEANSVRNEELSKTIDSIPETEEED